MNASNQIFHLPRFGRYARAHLSEKKRAYFWHFAILVMLYFLLLVMMTVLNAYTADVQMGFYYTGLLGTGSVFAVRYFAGLGQSGEALVTLMQPVSATEKWLLALLTIVIAYPLVYTLLFELMTYPVSLINQAVVRQVAEHHNMLSPEHYQLFVPLTDMPHAHWSGIVGFQQWPFWLIYLGVCGYALTTSIYFKRWPLIKSLALGFSLFIVVLFAFILVTELSKQYKIVLFYWFERNDYNGDGMAIVANLLLWFIAPLLMWVASYFALQERDIA